MKYKYLLFLLLASCSASKPPEREYCSLPRFLETGTDYEFECRVPPYTKEVVLLWYYEQVSPRHLYYQSPLTPVTKLAFRSEMYFLHPGRYILLTLIQTDEERPLIRRTHYYVSHKGTL
jgi:hypothetical protein